MCEKLEFTSDQSEIRYICSNLSTGGVLICLEAKEKFCETPKIGSE